MNRRLGVVILGVTDGAQEHGVALMAHLQGLLGKGRPLFINSHTANQAVVKLKVVVKAAAHHLQDLQGLVSNLRADTIAGQNGYTKAQLKSSCLLFFSWYTQSARRLILILS